MFKIIKNPDEIEYNEISQVVKKNDGYCPDTKCPCKNFKEQQTEGFCHCGRFKKIKTEVKE